MARAKRSGKQRLAITSSRRQVVRADREHSEEARIRRLLGSTIRNGLCQELAGVSYSCRILIRKMESSCPDQSKSLDRVCDMVLAALAEVRAVANKLDEMVDYSDQPRWSD